MKNILKYYYNLEPNEIHQNNNTIKFTYLNKKYILYETNKNNQELNEIYKLHIYLLSIGFYCHKIVLNINSIPVISEYPCIHFGGNNFNFSKSK